MNDLKQRLDEFIERLENDDNYEMSEEMQDEYFELKEEVVESHDHKLIDKFNQLWETYENPDSKEEVTLRDMYPDTDGQFDLGEWD